MMSATARWLTLGIPAILLLSTLALVLLRWAKQRHRIFAVVFIVAAFGSCTHALWGWLHIQQLSKREFLDFGFEGLGWLLAAVDLGAAVLWLLKARNLAAVVGLIFAVWYFLLWMLACSAI